MAKIAVMAGSVYGGARRLADQVVSVLTELGHSAVLCYPARLDAVLAEQADHWLVVTSTTGQGDIPDDLVPFFSAVRDRFPLLTGKSWAVIALGDSSYFDTYCGAGEQFQALFSELQGQELVPMLRVDAGETLEPTSVALPWLREHYASL